MEYDPNEPGSREILQRRLAPQDPEADATAQKVEEVQTGEPAEQKKQDEAQA
jgi:hypothetical protein